MLNIQSCNICPLLIFSFSLLSATVLACNSSATLKIESQKEFDNLAETLRKHIKEGDKNVVIVFAKKHYYYKNNHINLDDLRYPDVTIKFKGNGASFISAGKNLINDGSIVKFKEGAGFIDALGNDYQNYSTIYQSDNLVEIIDETTKLCRIHCSDLKLNQTTDCTNIYIRLTSWYTSFLYHVNKISDGYVYFTADKLTRGLAHYGNYNVNYDFTVGKILPRFRLINAPVGRNGIVSTREGLTNISSEKNIHRCESGFLFFIQDCNFKHISIEEFNIIGCFSGGQMIRFNNLNAKSIIIKNSILSASRGIVINAEKTNNITVEYCEFHDNYQDVIKLSNTCNNFVAHNNKFFNNGKGLKNSFCIICSGANYHIYKNQIFDFNYGAIGVGVWRNASKGSGPCYGIVEKNHIFYTPTYMKDKALWTLIDSGAIYLWSKNDGAIIRNNFIHDYEGMGSNRGIYCDDGTNNCSVYGNIILNIGNCYSIDLRLSFALDNLKIGLKSNVNNRIYGNHFNNHFRFQGRKDDKSSIKGGNTILVENENNMPRIIKDNLVEESKDTFVQFDKQKWYKKGLRLVR